MSRQPQDLMEQRQCLESAQGSSRAQESLGEVGSAPSFASEFGIFPEQSNSKGSAAPVSQSRAPDELLSQPGTRGSTE